MKNNFFTSLLPAALLFFTFACGGFAQTTTITQTPAFSADDQDWYKTGTSPTIGKDYLFNNSIQDFESVQVGPNDLNVTAKMGYSFDLFSDIKNMDGGKVDVDLPVKVQFSYPADRTYGCGEEIPIATSFAINPGYQLNSLPPMFNMELGVKAQAGFSATYATPFSGGGALAELPAGFATANDNNYTSLMAGGETPFFGLNTSTGLTWPWQYNGGSAPNPPPPNSLPLIIPGFVTNLTKLSGTIDNPFVTNPADLISGKTISETATKKFLDIQFDPIQFQEYLTGFAMRKVESIPGVISLDYAIFSVPLDFDVYQTHKLKFEPSVDIQMQLDRPYVYRVRDESNNIVQTGIGSEVSMKAGHTLLVTVPNDNQPISVTPTYKLRNQFTTHIRDSVRVSLDFKALSLKITSPGLEICNPFDETECVNIGAISEQVGPVVDLNFDLTDFAFDAYPPTTFELGGFADVQGATFILQPDDQAPVAVYSHPTLELNSAGQATVYSIAQVTNNLSDQHGGGVTIVDQPTKVYTCADLGAQIYSFSARDNRCNVATYNAPLEIVDLLKPTMLVSAPFELELDSDGNATLDVNDIDNGSFDNCTIVSRSIDATTFDCNDIGAHTITLTATDQSGNANSASVVVTIVDKTAPNDVLCKNVVVLLDENGHASIAPADIPIVAKDNCSAVNQLSVTPNTFDCSDLGIVPLTLTVGDAHGNTTLCYLTASVEDRVAPNVVCQNVTLSLGPDGTGNISPAEVLQSVSDNCGTALTESVLPNAFTCAQQGSNTVVLTVTDPHGNKTSCAAIVTVVDNILPVMQCRDASIQLNANGQANLTTAQIDNGSHDNCSLALSLSQSDFTCADLGVKMIRLYGTDQAGNTAFCTSNVTIRDLTTPTALCKNATVYLNSQGVASLTSAQIDNGSADNCGIASAAVTPATFTSAHLGPQTAILQVSDASGNTATCTAVVTVRDVLLPVALCKNATIFLSDIGQATLSAAAVNNGSYDNAGIQSMTLSKTNFNCSNLSGSPYIVALTVSDAAGNTSVCNANITIRDDIAPQAICENTTVQLNAQGKATVYSADLCGESLDNCNIALSLPILKNYTAANLGTNNLAITVKDWSNNAATCTAQVTVLPYGGGNAEQPGAAVRAQAAPDNGAALTLYPNPTTTEANVQFQLDQDESVELYVCDANGRFILNHRLDGTRGDNHVTLQVGEWPAGVYFIDLRSKGRQSKKRLVVQRD